MSRPHTPPEQVTEALRRAGGNVPAAAAMLCVSASTVRRRLREAPHLWPVGVVRERPSEASAPAPCSAPRPTFDVDATLRAIREACGSVAVAARTLGISRQGLHDRIDRHHLWPEGVPREVRRVDGETDVVYRFYLAQFGGVWSVTRKALRRILAQGAAGGGYTIDGDGVRPLAERFSEAAVRERGGVLPQRWRRPGVVLLRPLRWTPEDFRAALRDFDAGRYSDLAP